MALGNIGMLIKWNLTPPHLFNWFNWLTSAGDKGERPNLG